MSVHDTVAKIWNEVLATGRGGADATFFELGGESIAAVRLVGRIEDELGVWLDVADIFEDDPKLAELVRVVAEKVNGAAA